MGYYSDVCIMLTRQGREIMKERLRELGRSAAAKEVRRFISSADLHRVDSGTGGEIFLWKNVKWYENREDFQEVWFFSQLLRSLPLKDYRFMRLGEYADDAEDQGTFWNDNPFNVHFERKIVIS